jgi:ribose 5-phosphate isomerase B
MRIAVASDHAGFRYKTLIARHLTAAGHDVADFGAHSEEPSDYPDFILPAAHAVAQGECERAVIFGGSGNGEAIAANRVRGVRCAVCWSDETARLARLHNDANVISFGQRLLTEAQVVSMVDIWLTTPFEGGRHLTRIQKLDY